MAGRSFTIPTIFTAVDRLSGTVRAMGRNMQAFAARSEVGLARAERGFRSLMSPLTAVNRLLRGFGVYIGGYLLLRLVGGLISIFSNFEQANANLAAIMGTTVEKNKALSDQAKLLGLTTAKTATEVVGLQIELARLGFEGPQILKMSAAIVSGSVALDAALDRTALLAGAMTRSFQKFKTDGSDTQHIMDVLAKGSNDTALSFSKLETSLPIVAGAANAVGISFERTVALLGALSNAGIDAHMSATSLRNIFIDSRRKGHSYDQVLQNIAKHVDTLTPAFNKFGRRTAVSAQILVRNLKMVEAETLVLQSVQRGYTNFIARKRLDTYIGSVTLLKAAYQGLILSIEDGTGPYAAFLKNLNKTLRAMLLLTTGTKTALVEFFLMDKQIQENARTALFWLNVLKWVAIAIISLKAVIIAWNVVAGTFAVIAKIATAATWLWNAALAANPVGLVIIAIGLLIVSITTMIAKWNTWGAALAFISGPLGLVVSLLQTVRKNWDAIGDAFTKGGFWQGLAKIGFVITDAILYPMQQATKLLAALTGFDWLDQAAKGMEAVRAKMGVYMEDESGNPVTKPTLNTAAARTEHIERKMETQQQRVSIGIEDSTGRAKVQSEGASLVPIKVTSTMQNWQRYD